MGEPYNDPELNYDPDKYALGRSTTKPGGEVDNPPIGASREALPRMSDRSFSPSKHLLNEHNDKRAARKVKDRDNSLVVRGKLNPTNDPRQFSPTEMYYTKTRGTGGKQLPVQKSKVSYEPEKDYFYQQEIPAPLAKDIAIPPGTSTVSPAEPLTGHPADAPQITKLKVPSQPVVPYRHDVTGNEDRPAQTVIISKEIAKRANAAREIAKQFARGQELQAADETSTSFRFRLRNPGDFVPGSMRTFQPEGKPGVSIVFGTVKKSP